MKGQDMAYEFSIGELVTKDGSRPEYPLRIWNETSAGLHVDSTDPRRTSNGMDVDVVLREDLYPFHTMHAHISEDSRDCDGRMTSERVEGLNEDEKKTTFGDIDFQVRIAGFFAISSNNARMSMDGNVTTWLADTDEGYESAEIRWCEELSCIS